MLAIFDWQKYMCCTKTYNVVLLNCNTFRNIRLLSRHFFSSLSYEIYVGIVTKETGLYSQGKLLISHQKTRWIKSAKPVEKCYEQANVKPSVNCTRSNQRIFVNYIWSTYEKYITVIEDKRTITSINYL